MAECLAVARLAAVVLRSSSLASLVSLSLSFFLAIRAYSFSSFLQKQLTGEDFFTSSPFFLALSCRPIALSMVSKNTPHTFRARA